MMSKGLSSALSRVCPGCGQPLRARHNVSIPESIICYKAGKADPDNPGNRLVTEWDCPTSGKCIFSPGGGVMPISDDYGDDFECRKPKEIPA